MKEKQVDATKLEFLVKLNDNIVVQRFFNVKGYNPKAKNSIEFYDFIKSSKNTTFNFFFYRNSHFYFITAKNIYKSINMT